MSNEGVSTDFIEMDFADILSNEYSWFVFYVC